MRRRRGRSEDLEHGDLDESSYHPHRRARELETTLTELRAIARALRGRRKKRRERDSSVSVLLSSKLLSSNSPPNRSELDSSSSVKDSRGEGWDDGGG